ncbi:hypothetical protein ACH5RR_001714 [Cinchona calisaya]|uniref:Uncharacterized protein n=1 Tax=Cinchona calisaya TaxID=153742 RepID=A0ABD3B4U4_9GENT
MLTKPDPFSSSFPTAPTTCGNCGVEEHCLLHNARHRGIFLRLCTTCVLRLHPQFFCPTCFAVYHPSPPPSAPKDAVKCCKCHSSSHTHCVGGPNFPNPYICRNCVNPNSPIFPLRKVKDLGIGNSGGSNGELRVIDKKAAKILLVAAKIAAFSMSAAAAAVAATVEEERRAKEAAFTRKRAREALEHVAYLVAKEKSKKKDDSTAIVTGVLRPSGGDKSGVVVANVSRNNGKGNVGIGNVERVDGSNDVLAALNAVELREQRKNGEFRRKNVDIACFNDVVPMDVEENRVVEMNCGGRRGNAWSGIGDNVEKIMLE